MLFQPYTTPVFLFRCTLLLFLFATFSTLSAQTLDDFEMRSKEYDRDWYFDLGVAHSWVRNPDAFNNEAHKDRATSLYLNAYRIRMAKGQYSFRYYNPQISDMSVLLSRILQNTRSANRSEGTSFSAGLIGWNYMAWNITEPKKFQAAIGFSFADYFFGSTYVADTISDPDGWATYEPHGYYWAAGPTIMGRFAIGKALLLQTSSQYNLSYWKPVGLSYGIEIEGYPLPHWWHFRMDLLSAWGFFAGWQTAYLINRGDRPNNARRSSMSLGYRFRF
ncbi:MAG: hypothetical protein ACFB10_15575 [Salibacteraceae bacterium]